MSQDQIINESRGRSALNAIGSGFWYVAIAALPLTSCVIIPINTLVRPLTPLLAIIGVAFMLMAGGLVWPEKNKRLPLLLLLVFFVMAIISTVYSLLQYEHPPLKGYSSLSAAAKGMLTLCIGMIFYFSCIVALQSERIRERSRLLLIGGMFVSLIVAIIQWFAANGAEWALQVTWWILNHVTVEHGAQGYLTANRAWGLALEPSWMASMLTVLLLPLSFFWWRERPTWLSALGIAIAYVGVGLTTSRGGLLAILLITLIAMGYLVMQAIKTRNWRKYTKWGIGLLMIFMVSLVLGMRTTVNDYLEDRSIKGLLSQEELLSQQQMGGLGMLYRLASAEGAKKTFFEHPVIGTGIGLSPWSIRYHMMQDPTPELRTNGEYLSAVDEDKGLMPNAKNMPLRLLAETGLLGFALYIFFILAHGPRLFSSRWEFIVLPLMVLAALVVDWMSLDSFALAAPWLALAWSRQITLDAELKEKIN